MGTIKGTKVTSNNKVEYTISVDYEQSLLLQGHMTNIHIFSENSAQIKTNIVSRGKGNTKYIRIPSKISSEIKNNSNVSCMKMDSEDQTILFFVLKK